MTGLPENGAGPRHPLERLLAPVEPIAVSDPSWASARDAPAEALVHCRVGSGKPTWVRTGDWRLYARLDGASDGPDAGEAIASFVAEGGRTARGYRARDGRVVVPFGFAEAYAGYAAELWARGRSAVRPLPAAAQCLLSAEARDPPPRPARCAEGLDPRPG